DLAAKLHPGVDAGPGLARGDPDDRRSGRGKRRRDPGIPLLQPIALAAEDTAELDGVTPGRQGGDPVPASSRSLGADDVGAADRDSIDADAVQWMALPCDPPGNGACAGPGGQGTGLPGPNYPAGQPQRDRRQRPDLA